MKLAIPTVNIERSDVTTEVVMGIDDANKHVIMNLLRSELYSDPIGSFVREIISNAVDAHTRSKQDRPVEVTLPNPFAPELVVRDYGYSMTIKVIELIYSQLGTSTKRDSNEELGCFGIGAASPLSYASNFSIETITLEDNRFIKRLWVQYVDESLIGKLSLLGEEEVEGPTGTTIKIPIEKDDYTTVSNSVVYFTQFLRDRVSITNIGNRSYKEYTYYHEQDDWKWIGSHVGSPYQMDRVADNSLVIMGGIPYPINTSSLGLKDSKMVTLMKSGLHLHAPLGSVTLTPSRENLKYSDKTKQYLANKLIEISAELTKVAERSVADCKYIHTAAKTYSELPQALKAVVNCSQWRGHVLKSGINLPEGLRAESFGVENAYTNQGYKEVVKSKKLASVELLRDTTFWINDLGGKIANKEIVTKYVIEKKGSLVVFTTLEPSDEITEFLKLFDTSLMSTLYPNFVKTKNRALRGHVDGYTFDPDLHRSNTRGIHANLLPTKIPRDKGGIYLVVDGGIRCTHAVSMGAWYYGQQPAELDRLTKTLGCEVKGMPVFNKSVLQKLDETWLTFQQAVDNYVDALPNKEQLMSNLLDTDYYYNKQYSQLYKQSKDFLEGLDPKSMLITYMVTSSTKEVKMRDDKTSPYHMIASCTQYHTYKLEGKSELKDLYTACRSRYPMLELGTYVTPADKLVDYIKLMDSLA
jgi:hypothetical protein